MDKRSAKFESVILIMVVPRAYQGLTGKLPGDGDFVNESSEISRSSCVMTPSGESPRIASLATAGTTAMAGTLAVGSLGSAAMILSECRDILR